MFPFKNSSSTCIPSSIKKRLRFASIFFICVVFKKMIITLFWLACSMRIDLTLFSQYLNNCPSFSISDSHYVQKLCHHFPLNGPITALPTALLYYSSVLSLEPENLVSVFLTFCLVPHTQSLNPYWSSSRVCFLCLLLHPHHYAQIRPVGLARLAVTQRFPFLFLSSLSFTALASKTHWCTLFCSFQLILQNENQIPQPGT